MKKLNAIIVSLPGSWLKILQYYIEDFPFIEVDHIANDGSSALQLVAKRYPDLMVVDSSISFEDVYALVRSVKIAQPDLQVVVIADTSKERSNLRRAGADYAISSCNFELQITKTLNEINQLFLENDTTNKIENLSSKQNYLSP
jgi:DNA-binding NarL/FixJ family response regulator